MHLHASYHLLQIGGWQPHASIVGSLLHVVHRQHGALQMLTATRSDGRSPCKSVALCLLSRCVLSVLIAEGMQ
jgi:hypothetical protein